ncbi:MAG: hypothetical protein Q9204_000736, partial [Flavoplaca sp. TL-2023a]
MAAPGITPSASSTAATGNSSTLATAPSSSAGLSSGAKAGIGVGVAIGVIAAVAAVLIFLRKRQQRKQKQPDASAKQELQADDVDREPPGYGRTWQTRIQEQKSKEPAQSKRHLAIERSMRNPE